MIDWVKLLIGCSYLLCGQTAVWFQMYAPIKIKWLDNPWFIYGMAIPSSFLFIQGIKYCVQAYDGEMWPSRFFTFAMGMVSFSLLTWFIGNEGMSPKTIASIVISIVLVGIQILWK